MLNYIFPGLQKLGVTAALINNNLTTHPLIHSILAANTNHVIVGAGTLCILFICIHSWDYFKLYDQLKSYDWFLKDITKTYWLFWYSWCDLHVTVD